MLFDKLFSTKKTVLKTPAGEFRAVCEDGTPVPFRIKPAPYYSPYDVCGRNDKVFGKITCETCFAVEFDAADIVIGKEYRIWFSSGEWNFLGSDERSTCYDAVIGDLVVGIGFYDPNGDEKMEQEMDEDSMFNREHCWYDETKFIGYTGDVLEDLNGYCFRRLDSRYETVTFYVGWLKADKYPVRVYESALDLWLC